MSAHHQASKDKSFRFSIHQVRQSSKRKLRGYGSKLSKLDIKPKVLWLVHEAEAEAKAWMVM